MVYWVTVTCWECDVTQQHHCVVTGVYMLYIVWEECRLFMMRHELKKKKKKKITMIEGEGGTPVVLGDLTTNAIEQFVCCLATSRAANAITDVSSGLIKPLMFGGVILSRFLGNANYWLKHLEFGCRDLCMM